MAFRSLGPMSKAVVFGTGALAAGALVTQVLVPYVSFFVGQNLTSNLCRFFYLTFSTSMFIKQFSILTKFRDIWKIR